MSANIAVRRRRLDQILGASGGVLASIDGPTARIGFAMCVVLLLVAVLGPFLVPYDPLDQNILVRFADPGAQHLLGADEYGRDMMSRLVHGSAASLGISLASVVVSLVIGVAVGIVAGYRGGLTDMLVGELVNLLLSFPTVVAGILVLVVLGSGTGNVVVALSISFISRFIRLARAETLSVVQRNFIEAAHAAGASPFHVMFRHILPNVIGTAVVSGTLWTATALRAEATLSFLGLGVQLPYPSWGNLIADGMPYVFSNPTLVLFPCLAIVFAVVAFNLVGDALRDILDPRLEGQ
jgi:peptide/nickel transport system permease protein